MEAMPRPRPPHLHKETNRHGTTVWYVRIGKGPRTRLRAKFGTPEFDAEYKAATSGAPKPGTATRVLATSLQWLWDSYRETGAWQTDLSQATRRQRENIMLHVLKESGDKPYAAIKTEHVQAGVDRRAKTPNAARNFLDTMKGLFRWAKKRQHIKADPTISGVLFPETKDGTWLSGLDARRRRDLLPQISGRHPTAGLA